MFPEESVVPEFIRGICVSRIAENVAGLTNAALAKLCWLLLNWKKIGQPGSVTGSGHNLIAEARREGM